MLRGARVERARALNGVTFGLWACRPPHCTVMVKVYAASETPEKPKGHVSNAFTFVFAFDRPVPKIIPQRCR